MIGSGLFSVFGILQSSGRVHLSGAFVQLSRPTSGDFSGHLTKMPPSNQNMIHDAMNLRLMVLLGVFAIALGESSRGWAPDQI